MTKNKIFDNLVKLEKLKIIDIWTYGLIKERVKKKKTITHKEIVEIENEVIEMMIGNIGKQYE